MPPKAPIEELLQQGESLVAGVSPLTLASYVIAVTTLGYLMFLGWKQLQLILQRVTQILENGPSNPRLNASDAPMLKEVLRAVIVEETEKIKAEKQAGATGAAKR